VSEDELGPGWGPVEPSHGGADGSLAARHDAAFHDAHHPYGAGGGRGDGVGAEEASLGAALSSAAVPAAPPVPVSSDVVIIIDD
jgi:hypothetical protein